MKQSLGIHLILPYGGGGGGLAAKLCPTLCNHMDCSLPGSFVHGISQARILEWTAIFFSRPWPSEYIYSFGAGPVDIYACEPFTPAFLFTVEREGWVSQFGRVLIGGWDYRCSLAHGGVLGVRKEDPRDTDSER